MYAPCCKLFTRLTYKLDAQYVLCLVLMYMCNIWFMMVGDAGADFILHYMDVAFTFYHFHIILLNHAMPDTSITACA